MTVTQSVCFLSPEIVTLMAAENLIKYVVIDVSYRFTAMA